MEVQIPTSVGDLLDRVAILRVKMKYLDGDKLGLVKHQHDRLMEVLDELPYNPFDLHDLERINEILWEFEDLVRREPDFAIYKLITNWNDERARVKKRVDEALGSAIREVKSYV